MAWGLLALAHSGWAEGEGVSVAWVEIWRLEAPVPVAQAAAGDVDKDGVPDVAVLAGGEIAIYAAGREGPRLLGRIERAAGPFTSVALADFDGDGAHDVWAGTAAPGEVAIYRYSEGMFRPAAGIRYAWDDVVLLLPVDLDGSGRLDLALLTRGGALRVYRWDGAGPAREEPVEPGGDVRSIVAALVDADGRDEIAVARGFEHVALFDWVPGEGTGAGELVRAWENYVWGGHALLAVGRFAGGPAAQLLVAASRGLVHLYGWEEGSLRPLGEPDSRGFEPARWTGAADLDLDGKDELVVGTDAGIEAWDVEPLRRSLAVPARQAGFAYMMEGEGPLLVSGPWGFARYEPRDAGYVRVVRRGLEVQLKRPAVVTSESVYLSAADWEALAGIRLRWDAEGRVAGVRGIRFLVGAGGEWVYDGRRFPLAYPPIAREGVLYLPVQFAAILGEPVLWDPFTRTLTFDR